MSDRRKGNWAQPKIMQDPSLNQPITQFALRRTEFTRLVRGIPTNILFNDYNNHSFMVVKQIGGQMAGFKVLVEFIGQNNNVMCVYKIVNLYHDDDDGLTEVIRYIASRLGINKITYMYLCLQDYGSAMVVEFVEAFINGYYQQCNASVTL